MWRVIISFSMLVFLSINWSREGTRGIVGVLEVLVEYSAGGQKLQDQEVSLSTVK